MKGKNRMNYIIISATCDPEKYKEIAHARKYKIIDSGQKFFLSIAQGIKQVCPTDRVYHISVKPVSYGTYSKRFVKKEYSTYKDVDFCYIPVINVPIFRNVFNGFFIKKEIKKIINNNSNESVVITDALSLDCKKAVKYCKKHCVKTIACITDIPTMMYESFHHKGIKSYLERAYARATNRFMYDYDAYIMLTETMREVIKNDKPYIIIDCIITPTMHDKRFPEKNIVLYAGKLLKDCGVVELAKAASLLKEICDVWLYGGNSDCEEELRLLEKETTNLKVHGVVSISEIQKIESSVTLLINPRSSAKTFARYSFPSKTAEYMMSGTPALMFKLPGIADEYDQYLYYLNECTPESIAASISQILALDKSDLMTKGRNAQRYVVENKNEISQSKRIVDFIEGIL